VNKILAAVLLVGLGIGSASTAHATFIRVSVEGVVFSNTTTADWVIGETRMRTTYLVDPSVIGVSVGASSTVRYESAIKSMRVMIGGSSYGFSPKRCQGADCYSEVVVSINGTLSGYGNAYAAQYFLGYDDPNEPHFAGVAFDTEEDLGLASPFAGTMIPPTDYDYPYAQQYINLGFNSDVDHVRGSVLRIKVTPVREPAALAGMLFAVALILFLHRRTKRASHPEP
jgi:hypothetical protein